MKLRFLFFGLLLFITGCAKDERAYPTAFKAMMTDYERAGIELATQPRPDRKTMTRDQIRARAVADIRGLVKMNRDFEARAKKLDPPEKYRRINVLVIRFMGEQAANDEEWARLVETRSPGAKAKSEQNIQVSLELLRSVVEEAGRIEADSERLAESLRDLERQIAAEAGG